MSETQRAGNINEFIKEAIDKNDVVVFMKGTKKMPMCGFSGAVAHIFNQLGVDFADYNVLENEELRKGIKEYNNWPTIPQVFVKGEFIGGCDITKEMFLSGELQDMLKQKGVLKA